MNDCKSEDTLHCIQYLPSVRLEEGGVVRFVLDICTVLSENGVNVTLLTQDASDVPSDWFEENNKPNVCLLNRSSLPGGLLTGNSLSRVCDLFDENTVVHLHVPWLASNLQVSRIASKYNIPYVITPHGSLDIWSMNQKKFRKLLYWRLLAKKMFKNSAFIHYTAEGEKDQVENLIIKNDVKIIPCAFDTSAYIDLPDRNIALEKFPDISKDKPNILFLSRLHPKKGAEILIEAVKLLLDKGICLNLLLAGPFDDTVSGYKELLLSSVSDVHSEESIHFIGMVSGDEKLSLYRNADIFVLPTHQENFGLVLVESMACEVPVITSYGVDIWKEINKGGAIIVNNTPQEVADKLEFLLEDQDRLKELGIESRDWVFKELAPGNIADSYKVMYQESIANS